MWYILGLGAAAVAGMVAFGGRGAAAYDNGPLSAMPMVGWATWCTVCGLFDYCSESEVRSIADAISVDPVLRKYSWGILIDDCWSSDERDAHGNIQPDPTRFPSGIPSLVSYLADRKLALGLYTCAGAKTCKFNRTGSGGHFAQDAATFASWGVQAVKLDNCHHPNAPPQSYVGNFSNALNSTGHEMFFLSCQWGEGSPWDPNDPWGYELTNSYRVGPDHLPVWKLDLVKQHLATFRASGRWEGELEDIDSRLKAYQVSQGRQGDGLEGVLQRFSENPGQGTGDYIIDIMPNISQYQRKFGFEDADFLETLLWPLTPYTDSVAEFSFWALWGTNMLISTDVRNMTEEKKSILHNTEVWDIATDPLSLPATQVSKTADGATVWSRDLQGGAKAVILFNPNDNGPNITVTASFQDIGWDKDTTASGRDLWEHKDVGPIKGSASASLKPHGVQFLKLQKK